jgi:phosphoglycerate kinase
VVDRLRLMLDHLIGEKINVAFAPDCVGEIAEELARQLESGQVLLLENLRFHPEEEANDPAFAKKLASLCEIYVNDAFGSAHRAHASTEGITHFVKQAAAGLLMEKELTYLGVALEEPARPFVAIIGGAKVSDKIGVIDNLLGKVDAILVGGGMAYTFLRAKGQSTGKSLVEPDKIEIARLALEKAEKLGVRFLLPVDHVLADRFAPDADTQIFSGDGPFPADWMALDIGPETIDLFSAEIGAAQTVVWNGPMGVLLRSRWPWRRTSPRPRLSVGEIQLRRLSNQALPTRSSTSRPAGARRSSFWRAKSCLASRRLPISRAARSRNMPGLLTSTAVLRQ